MHKLQSDWLSQLSAVTKKQTKTRYMTNFVQLVFAILNWFQSLLRVGTSAAWLNHNVNVNETRQHERNQFRPALS